MPPAWEAIKTSLPDAAIEHDAEVELAFDGRRLFNQQPLHLLALGSGLVSDQRHPEDVLGVQLRILARPGDFHAAALAAASGMNLRLDNNARRALSK